MSHQSQEPLLQQAGKVHAAFNKFAPYLEPLPDHEIARRGLELANEFKYEREQRTAKTMLLTMMLGSHGMPAVAGALVPPIVAEAAAWWLEIEPERKRFRAAVELVARNRNVARRELRAEIEAALEKVVVIPRLVWTGDELRTELRHFVMPEIAPTCGYVLSLLLDEKRGLGSALRLCELKECGSYFLKLPGETGGRPRLYCSRVCQAIVSASSSAARTKRWRARKARKAK